MRAPTIVVAALFSLLGLASTVSQAEAQSGCTAVVCNQDHNGCTYQGGASGNRSCCCNVSCDGGGCTCSDDFCILGCQFSCKTVYCANCSLPGAPAFSMTPEAIDRLAAEFPVAKMILSNISGHFGHPIYSKYVRGGTSVLNPPRGFLYKANVLVTDSELTMDIIFPPVPPRAGAPENLPPVQAEQPPPAPMRIKVYQTGDVLTFPLPQEDVGALEHFEPPTCPSANGE